MSLWILPISVAMPMEVTRPVPAPLATALPANSMHSLPCGRVWASDCMYDRTVPPAARARARLKHASFLFSRLPRIEH